MSDSPDPEVIREACQEPSQRGRYVDSRPHEPITGKDRYVEAAQRSQAELANLHRRARRQEEEARHKALAEVLIALAPAIEQTELALKAAVAEKRDIESDPLLRSVVAAQRELLAQLGKLGASLTGQPGENFDPQLHSAVATDPAAPAGQVSEVLSPGLAADGKTVVAAKVTVGTGEDS